ncbi:MAG: carboxypeptidase-like regulatory domain-containing protein [Chitinophagaceae bacterium]
MKKHLFFLFSISFITLSGLTQGSVNGRVIDAETRQPLEGASVFAQNTTIGAVTANDGSFKLSFSKGGYELIISFTGYISQRLNVEGNENKTVEIALQKEDKSLSEVVVRSSNEVMDGWEKHGSFFIEHFIGATPFAKQTTLQNPEVLKFYYYKRSDKLKVLATEPLRITNNALGYTLQYSLDSFVYYNKDFISSYRGNCLYLPMEGDTVQQQQWAATRRNAYAGSRLHFLRSYYDSSLSAEGFTVDILSSTDAKKFDRIANPYDTAYYLVNDSTADVELFFPVKISITYTKEKPEPEYLQAMKFPANVKTQISYVDLKDAISIMENGYFIEQKSWVNQGYWSWKNLADQLPYDYEGR